MADFSKHSKGLDLDALLGGGPARGDAITRPLPWEAADSGDLAGGRCWPGYEIGR